MLFTEKTEFELELRGNNYKIEVSTKSFGTFMSEQIFLKTVKQLTKLLGFSGGIELDGIDLKNIDLGFICNSLYENINENDIQKLITDIVSNTHIQYLFEGEREHENSSPIYNLQKKSDLDSAFAGKLSVLYDVIKFVMEVNFSDFLSRLKLSGKMNEKFKEVVEKVKAVTEATKSGAIKLSGKQTSKES